MSFNIDTTLEDMAAAVKAIVDKDQHKIKGYAKQIFDEEKQTLSQIALLRLSGQITDEEFQSEIEDEKDTVRAQLLALKVLNKATAQKAANAALDVLYKAVIASL
jgi:hypothetical protein